MGCYKCGGEEHLSKKNKRLMICRACRRAQYHARTPITPPDNQTKEKKAEFDDWLIKAEESYKRVLANRT
jgi:hypothetical protein